MRKQWVEGVDVSKAGNVALADSMFGKIEVDRRSGRMKPQPSAQCRFGQNSQFHTRKRMKIVGCARGVSDLAVH